MYVDGASYTGSGSFEVKDVHDSEHKVIHKVSSVTKHDVTKVVEAAQKAIPAWKKVRNWPPFATVYRPTFEARLRRPCVQSLGNWWPTTGPTVGRLV